MKTLIKLSDTIVILNKEQQSKIKGNGMTERWICEEDYSGCQFIDQQCIC